ncbi:MAG: hypothetical protein AMJ65_07690 [Phycisphaerae bacterium SG8_4]|nr:MAG: hypothetical protein AMJ65_07690 [Phycisphaerae bacterium SG8_4]
MVQQVVLFAFYFFLRSKERWLAHQTRYYFPELRGMVCYFEIEIWIVGVSISSWLRSRPRTLVFVFDIHGLMLLEKRE